MANTFNGIGTTYYGKRKFEQDGSYVTTKWFVLGFFPLIPLGSARVQYLESSGIPFLARTASFELLEELPTDGLQVLCTYIYTIFIIAWTTTFMMKDMSPVGKIIAIVMGISIPHVLRWFEKSRVGSA